MPLTGIKSLTKAELTQTFQEWGQPAYRVDQLLQWLYPRRAADWSAMSNLPKALRAKLAESFSLQPLTLVRTQGSKDTTVKFLWQLADHSFIESVLIPANPDLYGEASDRHTLCLSTQVGCAYGCKFCASGLEGFKRNLSADEIVEQVLAVERWETAQAKPEAAPAESRLVDNLVIMGMGEPLANYDNLMKALQILNAPWGGGIGARKITISTSGLAPQIRRLAEEPFQYRLAVSLHGATDEVRAKIMPVNRKYPLAELVGACEDYLKQKERMITFEYILIAGINDGPENAKNLIRLAGRLHAKINLIPYNTVEGLPWHRPTVQECEQFRDLLAAENLPVTLRHEKGHDIDAACGQLRLKAERELAAQGVPPSSI